MKYLFFALSLLLAAPAYAADIGFTPSGASITVAATATSGRSNVNPSQGQNVRVYNTGTVPVFVQCGDSGVVATVAASFPIPPTSAIVMGCGQPYMAVITTTTATVYLTPGTGS